MTYQETARIRHIAFYPVKSAARIEVPDATLTESGLVVGLYADHEFMMVRANSDERGVHHFITQRDMRDKQDKAQGLSVMTLIKPQFVGDTLRLTWRYQDPITVPPDRNYGMERPVRVWDDVVYAVDQGDEVAQWLSDHLNLPVRLVKAAGRFSRMARQNYLQNDNPVGFHDAYPIHWFPEESAKELSEKAGEGIPWTTFRPQIVLEGMPPQYEHKIHRGQIAGIPFVDPKPCDRCPVTFVDQETGKVRGKVMKYGKNGIEPHLTLAQYKKWIDQHGKLKVIFGENMLPLGEGRISVGDTMTVTSYRNPPLIYGTNVF